MIAVLCLLVGLIVGFLGGRLSRRLGSSSPALDELRETLENMERDYRLRVATDELSWQTDPRREPPRSA